MSITDFIQLLTPLSIICAIVFGFFQFRRNQKQDDMKESENNTKVLVKLENVISSLSEIKSEINVIKSDFKTEINSIKTDYRLDHDKIIILENDNKTLFNKIEEIRQIVGK